MQPLKHQTTDYFQIVPPNSKQRIYERNQSPANFQAPKYDKSNHPTEDSEMDGQELHTFGEATKFQAIACNFQQNYANNGGTQSKVTSQIS